MFYLNFSTQKEGKIAKHTSDRRERTDYKSIVRCVASLTVAATGLFPDFCYFKLFLHHFPLFVASVLSSRLFVVQVHLAVSAVPMLVEQFLTLDQVQDQAQQFLKANSKSLQPTVFTVESVFIFMIYNV
jgi:hypothetical protein